MLKLRMSSFINESFNYLKNEELADPIDMISQLTELLSAGKLSLRKWTTNSSELLKSIAANHRDIELIGLSDNKSDKVMKTLMALLSDVAKLFCPHCWIGPMIITARILYQDLSIAEIQLDDFLPALIDTKWKEFSRELSELEKI